MPADDSYDDVKLESEKIFTQSLREYYDRLAERAESLRAEETLRRSSTSRAMLLKSKSFRMNSIEEKREEAEEDEDGQGVGMKDAGITSNTPFALTKEESIEISRELDKNDSVIDSPIYISQHALSSDDLDTHLRLPKMQQYFKWMEGLNRLGIRNLKRQADSTAEALREMQTHSMFPWLFQEESGTVDWGEVGRVFQAYGLTPQDLNINWMPHNNKDDNTASEASAAAAAAVAEPTNISKAASPSHHYLHMSLVKSQIPGAAHSSPSHLPRTTPSTPARHLDMLMTSGTTPSHGPHHAVNAGTPHARSEETVKHDAEILNAKIERAFKTYNPSSWRDELIRKKKQELAAVSRRRSPSLSLCLPAFTAESFFPSPRRGFSWPFASFAAPPPTTAESCTSTSTSLPTTIKTSPKQTRRPLKKFANRLEKIIPPVTRKTLSLNKR